MKPITITRMVNAPIDLVFQTVSDVRQFSQVAKDVVSVEFLTEFKTGVGTRFIETRLMNGKQASTELEVAEYFENEKIRMVADSHGTVWDTVFRVKPVGDQTELTMVMEARAHKILPKLVNPLIKGIVTKAVAKDMDSVKAYCEKKVAEPQSSQ